MSAARRGTDFERRVRRRLESEGWFVVRSAGSRGPVDLVAVRRNGHGGCEVRLIQCKAGQPHFTLNDWSLLVQAALDAGATAWLAYRDSAASHYAIVFKSAALEDAPHRRTDERLAVWTHPPGGRTKRPVTPVTNQT